MKRTSHSFTNIDKAQKIVIIIASFVTNVHLCYVVCGENNTLHHHSARFICRGIVLKIKVSEWSGTQL